MSDVIGMDPVTKLEIAKQKKQVADQAFKTGDIPSGMAMIPPLYYVANLLHFMFSSLEIISRGGRFAVWPCQAIDIDALFS